MPFKYGQQPVTSIPSVELDITNCWQLDTLESYTAIQSGHSAYHCLVACHRALLTSPPWS